MELREHNLDLAKAASSPNAAYMIRLMYAVNDLLTIAYLYKLSVADRHATPRHVALGTTEYLMLVQQSHLFEAYDAFITKIPTASNSRDGKASVANLVKKNIRLSEKLRQLKALQRCEHFDKLNNVRNNLIFHYNWADEGKLSHEALEKMVQSGDQVGVIHGTPAIEFFRFTLADDVRSVVFREQLKVHTLDDLHEIRDYIDKLKFAFTDFAESLILHWVATFNLQHSGAD